MSEDATASVLARLEVLISTGEYEAASELAQGVLSRLSATTDPRLLGAVQVAYVRAELGAGRPTADLGRRCREALRNLRGDALETRVRLASALLGLQVGEFMADAQDALVWLRERRASLETEERLELIIYESLEARLTGGDPLPVFDRGVTELEGTRGSALPTSPAACLPSVAGSTRPWHSFATAPSIVRAARAVCRCTRCSSCWRRTPRTNACATPCCSRLNST